MPTVYQAEPFDITQVGSMGNASCMFICQHDFPNSFSAEDKLITADHDRCMDRDYSRYNQIIQKFTGFGEGGLWQWLRENSKKRVMQFMIEFLEADSTVNWTGCRAMLTVHRGNGWPVVTLQLFAKHPGSKTKIYSGANAPNVQKI
jgi:hypothetical protein